ncbi:immunity 22 family protein [Sporosarcina sp. 6E9]|uniref:immunity 22 family protein n=1 Tax=Sporosarcina sp. 6E9 TaxID=2819235 RepID=UPI001B30CED5|nr:immunity 22 family protein [Sporosarcina sp. 6E9]
MQKEGFVSLWGGKANSSVELEKLLEIFYTEKGDFIPSKFAQSFGIKRYDDAIREAEFHDVGDNLLSRLLEGFSYDEVIIPKFLIVCNDRLQEKYNVVILLYDFKYEGNNKETIINNSKFKFLGSVEYM